MDKEEKLIAALWAMYAAIQQAQAIDIYDEQLNSLLAIAKEAMIRCGQLEETNCKHRNNGGYCTIKSNASECLYPLECECREE